MGQRRHSSVSPERLICNSSLTSCASFHCFAQQCRCLVFRGSAFAVCCVELHRFATEFHSTVERTVKEILSLVRVEWSHVALKSYAAIARFCIVSMRIIRANFWGELGGQRAGDCQAK